jgi:hypothetical protein
MSDVLELGGWWNASPSSRFQRIVTGRYAIPMPKWPTMRADDQIQSR